MKKGDHIRRVGIVFAGGPAPAANAVIGAAAVSFLEDNRQVIGFFHDLNLIIFKIDDKSWVIEVDDENIFGKISIVS